MTHMEDASGNGQASKAAPLRAWTGPHLRDAIGDALRLRVEGLAKHS
jgi:hypothetical protein